MTFIEFEDYAIGFDELGFQPATLCDFEKEIENYHQMFKNIYKDYKLLDNLRKKLNIENENISSFLEFIEEIILNNFKG